MAKLQRLGGLDWHLQLVIVWMFYLVYKMELIYKDFVN